jgi:hypothetical protein
MEIDNVTMVELSLFITAIIGGVVAIIRQLEQSKCSKVKCLCLECDRSPEFKAEEKEEDQNINNNIPNTNNIDRV